MKRTNKTIDTVIQFRTDGKYSLIACEEKLGYQKGDFVKVIRVIPEYIIKNGIRVFRVKAEHKNQKELNFKN